MSAKRLYSELKDSRSFYINTFECFIDGKKS